MPEIYIKGNYWGNYIGETDDSLTLVEYLAGKEKKEISLREIFSDFGLDKLQGDFRHPEISLSTTVHPEGWEISMAYVIDFITDLAALLLECKINGRIDLCDLIGEDLETSVWEVCITATSEEHRLINQTLQDFAAHPLEYDLSEMCQEESMLEMAEVCERMRKELYG